MVRVTRQDIIAIAAISQLTINDDEIDMLVKDMQAVLDYAASLKDIAQTRKDDCVPLPFQVNVMREDVVHSTDPEPLRALAPVREGNFFVVPHIIKQG